METHMQMALEVIRNIKEQQYQTVCLEESQLDANGSSMLNTSSLTLNEEETLFQEMKNLYDCVKELEDRYYDTTMAWEKELRDLMQQNHAKQERLVALEGQVMEANNHKNEFKLRLDIY
jgi:hypothetical protein